MRAQGAGQFIVLAMTSSIISNNIISTEICIAPFPEVNQTKGALQKIEKQFTQTAQ